MSKLLLLLAVIGVAVWWLAGRRRDTPKPPARPAPPAPAPAEPQPMVACAHCGVHLPRPETVTDAAGRPFCSEAHRLAGPR